MSSFARPTVSLSLCAVAASLVAGAAFAGDSFMPKQPEMKPNDARCSAQGDGFFAVSGSDACIKITGYVGAGAEFVGGLRYPSHNSGPFDAAPASALRTRAGVGADARFDTPMGPGRLYIQVGRGNFQP